ncbi:thioredoxin-like protein [Plasmodium brasilianum]|uniref:Thioredoxin-like protein n=1 Tax=Plasmodium brasilianum TaxID=5824 RepID=A0ACB9YAB9_PLABR|nr:thioredoxin-like protein [Plasmodium brasilianum]
MIAKSEVDDFLRNIGYIQICYVNDQLNNFFGIFIISTEDATEETALYYLEMCNGNCNEAVKLYYEINSETTLQNRIDRVGDESIGVEETVRAQTEEHVKERIKDYSTEYNDYVREPDKHFSQVLIHDMDDSNFLHFNELNKKEKKVNIELGDTFGKLFSPPEFLICSLPFEDMRKKSKDENKYILVNIQNSEFDSLRLNRDIWNNDLVQEIIKNFFIFWLRYENDQDAVVFMNTYKVNKLPYICVLCKRTGRKLKVWNTKNFQDPICAQSQLYEFIETIETKNNGNYDHVNNSMVQKDNIPTDAQLNSICMNNESNYNHVSDNILHNAKKEMNMVQNIKKDNERNTNSCISSTGLTEYTDVTTDNKQNIEEEYNKINNELSELHKLRHA